MATFNQNELESIYTLYEKYYSKLQLKAKDPSLFKKIKQEFSMFLEKNSHQLQTEIIGRQVIFNQKTEDNILKLLDIDRSEMKSDIKNSEYFKKFGELQLTDQLAFAIPMILLSIAYIRANKEEEAEIAFLITFFKPYASRESQCIKTFGHNEDQMMYTVQNLKAKYDLKTIGSVLGVIVKRARSSFENYILDFKSNKTKVATDRDLHVIYTSGVATRMNSMLSSIYKEYKANYGKYMAFEDTAAETVDKDTDGKEFIDRDIASDAEIKNNIIRRVSLRIARDPVDMKLVTIAARQGFMSSSMGYIEMLRVIVDQVTDKMLNELPEFISCLIGGFLFQKKANGEKYTVLDIKTPVFIRESIDLFKHSPNAKDYNTIKAREVLEQMLTDYSDDYINAGSTKKSQLKYTLAYYWIYLIQKCA